MKSERKKKMTMTHDTSSSITANSPQFNFWILLNSPHMDMLFLPRHVIQLSSRGWKASQKSCFQNIKDGFCNLALSGSITLDVSSSLEAF